MSDDLLVRDEKAVRIFTLNRPATKNGLTLELNQYLIDEFDRAATDRSVRCLVLMGAGGSFCSGLDLKAAASIVDPEKAGDHLDRYFHGLIRAVRRITKPVVALVDGPAAGFGCDLALACDIRLGTARTRLGESFVKRGLMPDGGGTFHLPRIVGVAKALELMLSGDLIEADEALRLGLISRLLPTETALQETLLYAERLAAGAPKVHAWVKRAIYGSLEGTFEEALSIERQGQIELLRSKDFLEGVSAFFQKRDPQFTGE